MDPSKPNDPTVAQGQPIPRPRPAENEVLEGEVIDRGVPIGRPRTAPPPTPEPPTKKPGQFRRTLLLIIVGVAALTCLGGGVTAYVFYKKASEPDRGNPTATLQQYLDARFNKRDVERAKVFVCPTPNLSAVDKALDDVMQLEAKFKIRITMSTTNMVVAGQTSDAATVQVRIKLEIPEEDGRKSIQAQDWQFGATRANDWLICSATRLS